jgi:hypothetical protein
MKRWMAVGMIFALMVFASPAGAGGKWQIPMEGEEGREGKWQIPWAGDEKPRPPEESIDKTMPLGITPRGEVGPMIDPDLVITPRGVEPGISLEPE